MIKINLLAEGKRPAAVRRPSRALRGTDLGQWLLVGVLGLVVLGSAIYWWTLRSDIRQLDRQITVAEDEVRELAPIIKEVEEYKTKQAELEHKIAVITDLKANQQGPVRVMDAISQALPELLWLTRMEVEGGAIRLWGQAFNTNAIATFTENLDRVPEFQEPDFKETRREGEVYTFSIVLGYRLEPVPEAVGEEGGTVAAATTAG